MNELILGFLLIGVAIILLFVVFIKDIELFAIVGAIWLIVFMVVVGAYHCTQKKEENNSIPVKIEGNKIIDVENTETGIMVTK